VDDCCNGVTEPLSEVMLGIMYIGFQAGSQFALDLCLGLAGMERYLEFRVTPASAILSKIEHPLFSMNYLRPMSRSPPKP
jgi:hypothetical protein